MDVMREAAGTNQADSLCSVLLDSTLGAAVVSLENTWIDFNPGLCKILGYDRDELLGHSTSECTFSDDVAASRLAISSVLTGERDSVSFDKRYVRKDGHVVWARVRAMLARDAAGSPLHVLALIEDIGGEHAQIVCLRRAEARFRAAFNSASIGIAMLDLHGRFIEVNRAYCDMFGYTEAELLGQPVQIVVPPEDLESVALTMQRAVVTGEPVKADLRGVHKDGRSVYIQLLESLVLDDDGHPVYIVGHVQDVTEQHQAARARRATEERLQAVIANAPVTLVSFDAQGVFTFSGGNAPLLLDVPHADRIGRSAFEVFAALPEITEAVHRVLAGEAVTKVTHQHDGWFEMRWSLLRGADGAPAGAIGVITDITPQKRAEQALAHREARFRALAEHAGDLVCVIDASGQVTYESQSYKRLLGRSLAETQHAGVQAAMRPGDYELLVATLREMVSDGTPIARFEGCIADVHGAWHTLETVAVNRLADPAVEGIIATSRDVTERKAAEAAFRRSEAQLRESEARLRRIVETAGEGIWTLDANFVTSFVNRRMAEMLGYTVEEMIGRPVFEFMDAEERRRALDGVKQRQALASEQFDRMLLTKDGRTVLTAISATRISDEAGAHLGTLAMVSDVTARRQMERALARSNRELARSNAELEQFTSVASHDLRTPLNTIGGFAELLSMRLAGTDDAETQEYLGLIVDGVKHMQTLIDDLLAFARLGAAPAPAELVDCAALVERVIPQLQSAIRESGAVVSYRDLPVLCGHGSRLGQLFQNLIGNAIKFHGKEAPRVTISARRDGADWLFVVEDNGIGIAPACTESIFVIFRRLHSRNEYPGTGIGLALCKKIVEQHGGRIWVESQPGQGARFCFTLPATPVG